MTKSKLIAAVTAAVIGTAAVAASTAPAAADGAYFGFQSGGHYSGGPSVRFGFSTGPSYPAYRPYYPAYRPYPVYRPHYQAYRPRPVCEDVWRVREIYNRWGEVVKVVRVRDRECYRY